MQVTLKKDSRQSLISLIGKLYEDGSDKTYFVTIKEANKRSIAQNKRYWEILTGLGKYLGYSPEEMHSLVAYKYLSHTSEIMDEEITVVPSTTKLNIKEFTEYMGNVEAFAHKLGYRTELHGY
tara:strand:+ start:1923 stop:2291 length:369 start_codon:yes stop_codon:yes gene_type:complete